MTARPVGPVTLHGRYERAPARNHAAFSAGRVCFPTVDDAAAGARRRTSLWAWWPGSALPVRERAS